MGYRQARIALEIVHYKPWHEKDQNQNLEVLARLSDIHRPEFYDSGIWNAGKHADLEARAGIKRTGYLNQLVMTGTLKQGLAVNGGEDSYTKLQFWTYFRSRLGVTKYLRVNVNGGWIPNRDKLPLQERIYASGSPDPAYDDFFIVDRTGRTFFSSRRNLVRFAGAMVRGYPWVSGNISALTINVDYNSDILGLFVDLGRFEDDLIDEKMVGSFGLSLRNDLFMLHFPLYLSDPKPGDTHWVSKENYANRFYISIMFRNLGIGY